jgi:hypothetical protein
MPALFLALLTCALAMLGSRPALLTARLAGDAGGGAALLVVCWIVSAITAALAGWAGSALAPLMAPAAGAMFVAAALAIAAIELAILKLPARPAEPTRSLGAVSLVLFAGQVTDAARFLILAVGVATEAPAFAAFGGAFASGAVLTFAWALGNDWEARLPLRALSRGVAGLFLLAAVIVALAARDVIG